MSTCQFDRVVYEQRAMRSCGHGHDAAHGRRGRIVFDPYRTLTVPSRSDAVETTRTDPRTVPDEVATAMKNRAGTYEIWAASRTRKRGDTLMPTATTTATGQVKMDKARAPAHRAGHRADLNQLVADPVETGRMRPVSRHEQGLATRSPERRAVSDSSDSSALLFDAAMGDMRCAEPSVDPRRGDPLRARYIDANIGSRDARSIRGSFVARRTDVHARTFARAITIRGVVGLLMWKITTAARSIIRRRGRGRTEGQVRRRSIPSPTVVMSDAQDDADPKPVRGGRGRAMGMPILPTRSSRRRVVHGGLGEPPSSRRPMSHRMRNPETTNHLSGDWIEV